MKCKSCGFALPQDIRLCPNCGTYQERPIRKMVTSLEAVSQPGASIRLRRFAIALTIVVVTFLALLAVVAASIYAGIQAGLSDRAQLQAQEAGKFFQQGLDDLAAGRLALAEADFAYVLQLNPDHPEAAQKLQETRNRIIEQQTIDPTPTTSLEEALKAVLVAAREAYEAQEWESAIERLIQVRRLAPTLSPQDVEDMLFTASYTFGLQLLEEDRLEEGVYYLEQAARLRPLDQDAATQAEYAKQYLTALGYWNVNWEQAIDRFGELVAIAPGYRDAYDRYVMAHVLYADSYTGRGDFCPAQPLYQEALSLRPDTSVQAKLDSATSGCLSATPVAISGTFPISGTPSGTPIAVPGIDAGRLAYPVYDEATGAYTIYAVSPGAAPFPAAAGGQPSWQPGAPRLAYRVLGIGINVLDLSSGAASLVAPAGSAWPTWSPDGSRIAYALRDAAGNFRIVIALLDGSGTTIDLGPGKSPTWGPNGLLAYAGCDASGCGVMIDNPDDPDPPSRLTASASDTPTSWSPDGFNISYFSDTDGDWDVYFVNTAGGVAQVINSPGNDGIPAWSPDGAHLAFVSDRDGAWAIYTVRFDGQELTKAIDLGPANPNWLNERLAWSP